MHSFAEGKEHLRTDLLAFVGSQQRQSGVIWGSKEPGCVVCTTGGRHGRRAGYQDREVPGGWMYFGQGTVGDQSLKNAANVRLASGRVSVLLFSTREPSSQEIRENGGYGKLFMFRGEFNVLGYDFVHVMEGVRSGDRLLCFQLIRVGDSMELGLAPERERLDELRSRISTRWSPSAASAERMVEYRRRCSAVRNFALFRANGICEGCDAPAPFLSVTGRPFLEVHHLHRLADDGPDTPENVAALCPNCHRRAHLSRDRGSFQQHLVSKVKQLEVRAA